MKILQEIKSKVSIPFCLAILVAINGYLVLSPVLLRAISHSTDAINNFNTWKEALSFLELFEIPRFMIGLVLILMAIALSMGTRIAWFFTVLLLVTIVAINLFILKDHNTLTTYSIVIIVALIFYWRDFDYHSLGSGTFFAVVSIASLIVYSMLGTLYMGDEFAPAVTDLPTAFYFAIVCMSTVGFGDIIPHTTLARMFTLTVILSGITVFAASISSIAGPMISNNIKRIVKGRISHVERKNHFIIVGTNSWQRMSITAYVTGVMRLLSLSRPVVNMNFLPMQILSRAIHHRLQHCNWREQLKQNISSPYVTVMLIIPLPF